MPRNRLRRLQTRSAKCPGGQLCGCGETSSGFLTSKSRSGEQMPVLSTVVDELTQKLPKICCRRCSCRGGLRDRWIVSCCRNLVLAPKPPGCPWGVDLRRLCPGACGAHELSRAQEKTDQLPHTR